MAKRDAQREDEVQVGAREDAAPADVSQEQIDNAPDSAETPHLSPSKGVLQAGADMPHDTPAGVAPSPIIIGTDVPVAPEPEGTKEAARAEARSLEQAPPPDEPEPLPELPEGAFDSQAFRAANASARDAFASVVRRPGHIFRDHGGRYVSIFDLNEVYDVEPGSIVPDGLFLFPVNYLVRDDERQARIRG